MAEGFVRPFRKDYVGVSPLPGAKTVPKGLPL
jgi:hypothetical protein